VNTRRCCKTRRIDFRLSLSSVSQDDRIAGDLAVGGTNCCIQSTGSIVRDSVTL
jgi:hypothetical protein